jgi:hypothetical protein
MSILILYHPTLFEVNVFNPIDRGNNTSIIDRGDNSPIIDHGNEESVDKLKDSTEIQIFTCNVCRLLACVADCIQTDVESGQSSFPDNLVTEWNEFFSEGIYGVLLPLFLKIAG